MFSVRFVPAAKAAGYFHKSLQDKDRKSSVVSPFMDFMIVARQFIAG